MQRRAFLASSALAWAAPAMPSPAELRSYREKCRKVLLENILPFWYPRTLDKVQGGYTLHHDPASTPKGPEVKMIVSQAGMLYFYARLARFGHEPKAMLGAAEHGYKFLRTVLWDARHGGFFWETDAAGKPTKRNKHLYGQSFGLLALSEYALASGRKDVLQFAMELFGLLEKHSHDAVYGGYGEYFLEDWSTPAPNELIYVGGTGPGLKLRSTHLHLLEAITAYYRATKQAAARERLLELMTISANAVIRKGPVAATDKFDRDWSPRREVEFQRVNYGYDLANISRLADAAAALATPVYPYRELLEASFAYCQRYGFDESKGGFFREGGLALPADQRSKDWWVQAEGLLSALTLYKLTGRTDYFAAFRQSWEFCEKEQIDWQNGEWHARVEADGSRVGEKAGPWKSAHHNGRAMMEAMALLQELEGKSI